MWISVMILWEKLWNYGQNYGTMDKTNGSIPRNMELRFMKGKHGTCRLPKTKKLWIIIEIIEVFHQISGFRTLLYYGKTIVLWKKLWYFTENYGTSIYEGGKHDKLPKAKKLWFIIEKNYGKIPKYLKFFLSDFRL